MGARTHQCTQVCFQTGRCRSLNVPITRWALDQGLLFYKRVAPPGSRMTKGYYRRKSPRVFSRLDLYCLVTLHRALWFTGLPWWYSGKKSACAVGDLSSVPGSGRCPGEWLPTPVFLPGEFYGQRILVGYSPWGQKESDMTE